VNSSRRHGGPLTWAIPVRPRQDLSLSQDMIHNEAGNRAETFGRCAASGLLIVGRTPAGLTRFIGGDGLAQASCRRV
jgi:hypothetical protein